MCCPPGGKPLASVLERGCGARDCSGGDPEMWIGYGQYRLQSSLQLSIPQRLNLSSGWSFLWKNHAFVTTALAPAFSPKAWQHQPPLFLFSSAFWLFTSHEIGDCEGETMTSQAKFLRHNSDCGGLRAFQTGKLPPELLECKQAATASQATECFPGPEDLPTWKPLQILFVLEKLSVSMWHNQQSLKRIFQFTPVTIWQLPGRQTSASHHYHWNFKKLLSYFILEQIQEKL